MPNDLDVSFNDTITVAQRYRHHIVVPSNRAIPETFDACSS